MQWYKPSDTWDYWVMSPAILRNKHGDSSVNWKPMTAFTYSTIEKKLEKMKKEMQFLVLVG